MSLTWNLKDIYINEKEWKQELQNFQDNIEEIKFEQIIEQNDLTLLYKVLEDIEEGYRRLNKIYNYALLQYDTNINNDHSNKVMVAAEDLYSYYDNYLHKFHEWLENNKELIYSRSKVDGKLKKYLHTLEDFENKTNVVEMESALSIEMMYKELLYADNEITRFNHNDKQIVVRNENHLTLLESQELDIRKGTYMAVLEELEKKKDFSAFLLNAHNKIQNIKARENGEVNSFDYHLKNKIGYQNFNFYSNAINENLNLFHKIIELKKKNMQVDKISYYDMYPLIGEFNEKIDIAEAKHIIFEALSPLGQDYLDLVQKVFDENWIDWSPYSGKRTGGYSLNVYDAHPYILINWQSSIDSLYTLIHEIGGAIASYISSKNQSFIYSEQSILITEISSMVNEGLLSRHLLDKYSDSEIKLSILHKYVDKIRENFFQTFQLVEFEKALALASLKERLTAELISNIYVDTISKYYDSEHFEDIELNKFNWVRIPHLYKNFYNLDYVVAVGISEYIVEKIYEDDEFKYKYIKLFSNGCSKNDMEILKGIGININSDSHVNSIIKILNKLLTQLEG
ncbi:hypothetical protein [Bacillus mycoides]|uniref:Oligoendopeptidase F n=1 Tax=Bacillus mycoides TaxID=1405 RepID=A0A1E8B7J1_BACMY|nr:hypothetical protein [Bacillus mycoides]OFD70546.1 oligoendopeptidase F [Bacillus mycoides]OFD71656.1 oligoendopeptidase F [Bacillus mycoides]OFD79253.1 oligoendopeptidase F [Bacillus mycoides]